MSVCACILWIHLPVRLFGMRAACAAALCAALFKRSTHMRSFSMLPFPLPRPTSPPTPSPPALILCACWQLIPLRSKHRKLSLPTSRRQRQLRFRHEDAFHNNSNNNKSQLAVNCLTVQANGFPLLRRICINAAQLSAQLAALLAAITNQLQNAQAKF